MGNNQNTILTYENITTNFAYNTKVFIFYHFISNPLGVTDNRCDCSSGIV